MSNGKRHIKIVYMVHWKLQKNHFEIFNNLETFACSYPRYSLTVLKDALAFGKTVFENDEMRIEKKSVVSTPKPDLPRRFFWEFDYDRMNWRDGASTVIHRILERGTEEHWNELVRYYGKQTIVNILKESITCLRDDCIDKASLFFDINKEEMLCYKRKLSLKIHWP